MITNRGRASTDPLDLLCVMGRILCFFAVERQSRVSIALCDAHVSIDGN